jgi:copper chaperone CopZ
MTDTTRTERTSNLYSDELSCPSCVPKIEKRLQALPGVSKGVVHFGSGRIEVVHDPELTTVADLVAAVRQAGYAAAPKGFQ